MAPCWSSIPRLLGTINLSNMSYCITKIKKKNIYQFILIKQIMKIIKQLIFLLLFFLLQISCSNLNKKNKSDETQNDRFELPQKELKGHKFKFDSTIMR